MFKSKAVMGWPWRREREVRRVQSDGAVVSESGGKISCVERVVGREESVCVRVMLCVIRSQRENIAEEKLPVWGWK